MQAIFQRMVTRPTQAIATDEGGKLFGAWNSRSAVKNELITNINDAWMGGPIDFNRTTEGGRHYYIQAPGLTILLMLQESTGFPLYTGPGAENGWFARNLVAWESGDLYAPPRLSQAETSKIQKSLTAFRMVIARQRQRQDSAILDNPPSPGGDAGRVRIQAMPMALDFKYDIHEAQYADINGLPELVKTWSVRMAQQCGRVAATLAAWREYERAGENMGSSPPNVSLTLDDMHAAFQIVRWYFIEAKRIVGRGQTSDFGLLCEKAVRQLVRCRVGEIMPRALKPDKGVQLSILGRVVDAEQLPKVREALFDHGCIMRPGNNNSPCYINPYLVTEYLQKRDQ